MFVDAAAALDLGFGVGRSGFVGSLLGDQRLLEDLEHVGHGADLGLLAPVRHFGGQVALAQRLHRLGDGVDAVGDITDQIEADSDADHDGDAENDRNQHEGIGVAVGGILERPGRRPWC